MQIFYAFYYPSAFYTLNSGIAKTSLYNTQMNVLVIMTYIYSRSDEILITFHITINTSKTIMTSFRKLISMHSIFCE